MNKNENNTYTKNEKINSYEESQKKSKNLEHSVLESKLNNQKFLPVN